MQATVLKDLPLGLGINKPSFVVFHVIGLWIVKKFYDCYYIVTKPHS